MIGLLALALQSASADQVVDTMSVGTVFQTTAETQPTILYYQDCLAPPGVMVRPPVSGTAEARARARIEACAATRKWAISSGLSVYKPKRGGDPDAAHFMNTSLDQIEQGFLAQARFEDKLITGKIKPTDLKSQPVVLAPDGAPNERN